MCTACASSASLVLRYDADLRVPLLFRGPGIPKGIAIDQLVGLPDLAPTILELTVSARAVRSQWYILVSLVPHAPTWHRAYVMFTFLVVFLLMLRPRYCAQRTATAAALAASTAIDGRSLAPLLLHSTTEVSLFLTLVLASLTSGASPSNVDRLTSITNA